MHTTGTPETLLRSRDDRIVAGVAGGLAEYYKIDSLLVRLAFVGLAFVGGLGFLLYVIAWMLMPEASSEDGKPHVYTIKMGPQRGQTGAILIAIGVIFLFINVGILTVRLLSHFWPVILILIGVAALRRTR